MSLSAGNIRGGVNEVRGLYLGSLDGLVKLKLVTTLQSGLLMAVASPGLPLVRVSRLSIKRQPAASGGTQCCSGRIIIRDFRRTGHGMAASLLTSKLIRKQKMMCGHYRFSGNDGQPAGEPKPAPQTDANESWATLSPDGRLLAYASDESSRYEVYVQSFPAGAKRQLSTGRGNNPRWRRDGKELVLLFVGRQADGGDGQGRRELRGGRGGGAFRVSCGE